MCFTFETLDVDVSDHPKLMILARVISETHNVDVGDDSNLMILTCVTILNPHDIVANDDSKFHNIDTSGMRRVCVCANCLCD